MNSICQGEGSLVGSCPGEVCTPRLYGGLSSTRSALISKVFRALAKFSNMCDEEFSNADSCCFGRIQVSNGNRGAYGAIVKKFSFSATTRLPFSVSCRIISQKTQRSLYRKYCFAPSISCTTLMGKIGSAINC